MNSRIFTHGEKIQTSQEAVAMGLYLAIIAPDDEQLKESLDMAESIANRDLSKREAEEAMAMADTMATLSFAKLI